MYGFFFISLYVMRKKQITANSIHRFHCFVAAIDEIDTASEKRRGSI